MKKDNNIVPFQFENHPVRIITDETDNPWWVAKDVCDILNLTDTFKATQNLDDDEKGTKKVRTPGGEQEMIVVNESGLYTLIIRSNKPEARPFRKWITSEVLPAIRKTGAYASGASVVELAAKLLIILQDAAKAGFCDIPRVKELCWLRSLGLTQDMAGRAAGLALNEVQSIEYRLKAMGIRIPTVSNGTRSRMINKAFEEMLSSLDQSALSRYAGSLKEVTNG